LDRVEIRPGQRELPEDSLEKFRQKQQSAELYPNEPPRPLQHPEKTRGFQNSGLPDYVSVTTDGLENAKRANEQLQRAQQEKQSGLNRDASRDDLLRHENEVRLSHDPATREQHKQQLKEITKPSDRGEKYFERQFASTLSQERLTDVSSQTLSTSRNALLQHENTVRVSSDPATRENLRQELNAKTDITRTDYQEIGRGLKREELNRHINGAARETTGKEIGHDSRDIWPNRKNDRAPDKSRGPEL
jgi:hypothetical protein